MLQVAGVFAMTALGCGSDDAKPSTLAPLAADGAGSEAGAIEMEAGRLTPIDPLAQPENGAASGSGLGGLVGFVDGEADDDTSCVDQFVGVTGQPPVIQFVVDTSGSMTWVPGAERLPNAGERSKWQITEEALALAISNMPDAAAVGISYYPNTPGGGPECFVPVVAAPIERLTPEQRASIEQVSAAQRPEGGTPTHAAYEFGIEQLEASTLPGSRFLVLITDGIPTFTLDCGGDGQTRVDGAPLVASVGELYESESIRTFVIGSPGSEPARDELSQMALVGGTGAPGCEAAAPGACHFDMTGAADFSAALSGALGDIAEATLGCDYAVPEAPTGRSRIDLNDVSVVIESGGSPVSEFQRATSAACESGWQYSADQTSIQLCRASCDELNRLVSANPDTSVRVKFGCALTPT
jgi:von Willebrand factor type A domain